MAPEKAKDVQFYCGLVMIACGLLIVGLAIADRLITGEKVQMGAVAALIGAGAVITE